MSHIGQMAISVKSQCLYVNIWAMLVQDMLSALATYSMTVVVTTNSTHFAYTWRDSQAKSA